MKRYYYIYKITNLLNGKYYIGVHKTKNLEDGYMGSGTHLKEDINKYGVENFQKEILRFFNTEEEMWQEEAEIVNTEFIKNENNYNLNVGGNSGFDYLNYGEGKDKNLRFNSEWQRKNSKKGHEALKRKYGKNYGHVLRKKWEEAKKEKYGDPWQSVALKGYKTFLGKKHTEQSKAKIGKSSSIHQKGKGNSQFGKCWVYNIDLQQNKSIPKKELNSWIEKGWQKGRKMKW